MFETSVFNDASQTILTTAETELARITVKGVRRGEKVHLDAETVLTVGTTTTSVVPRIRRDSLAGATVSGIAPLINVTAGNVVIIRHVGDDEAAHDDPTYLFTVVQTGATANGSAVRTGMDGGKR